MLLPHDAALARRDSAIPGLGLLLDPEALADKLRAALPEADVRAAQPTYVKYKPGVSCLVAYRLKVAGTEADIYAKAYRVNGHIKLEKARRRQWVCGPLGPGGVNLDDLAVAVSVFPNDTELKVLTLLADEEARRSLFTKLLPDQPSLWGSSIHRLRYKPERRYVGQLMTEAGIHAVVRIYEYSEFKAARHGAQAFVSQGPLRVARVLRRSNRRHILIMEWLPGHPLSEAVRDPRFQPDEVRAVGEALAVLHAQRPKRLERQTAEAEASGLHSAAGAVAVVCPDLAGRAQNLALRLLPALSRAPGTSRPIHGDFSTDQVLLDHGSVGFLDFDRAVLGDPAADLGSFAARLERDALAGDLPPSRVKVLKEALLEGYGAPADSELAERISFRTGACLLRLAAECFRSRQREWPERMHAILARAEELLTDG